MKTTTPTPRPARLAALAAAAAVLLPVFAHAQAFQPGEILVNEANGNSVQRYSAAGVLTQTYTGTGTTWEGAALAPNGSLVTGYRNPVPGGINVFSPGGTQTTTFAATGNGFEGDVSVFPNGTVALNDQSNNAVQFFTPAGILTRTAALPGISDPFGSTVGSDGVLYVAGLNSNNFARVSASGANLGNVALSFQPGDLVMNPLDGTLWISGSSNQLVEHVKTDGTVLGSFATGLSGNFEGIGLGKDNASLYVTGLSSTVVKHFDLNGNLLDQFNLTSPNFPFFITVVPIPEPSTWALLGLGITGAGVVTLRQRRRAVRLG